MIRWLALLLLLLAVGVSGWCRHRARRDGETIPRRREGGLVLLARLTAALLFVLATLAHVLAPERMAWASFKPPGFTPWLGVALGLLVVPAVYWVLSSLGRNVSETVLTKQQHQLVTSGPYRWVRHGLYTTGITLLLAMGLMLSSWLLLLFALVALIAFRFLVIPAEERALVAKFGDEYVRYKRRTGRLLPRVRAWS